MKKKSVDEEFAELLDKLTTRQFWAYISTWKDESALHDEMIENWDENIKKTEIKVLKNLMKPIRRKK